MENYIQLCNYLSIKDRNAVVDGNKQFNEFQKYIQIETELQLEMKNYCNEIISSDEKKIIFLTGKVGNGKSHLLSYLQEEIPNFEQNFNIWNDSSESLSPNETAIETLNKHVFNKLQDKHLIIAINNGILFKYYKKYKDENIELAKFIDQTAVLMNSKTNDINYSIYKMFDFDNYPIIKEGDPNIDISFIEKLYDKILGEGSLFHNLVKNETPKVVEHYEYFSNKNVKDNLIFLITMSYLKNNIDFNVRDLNDFFYNLISLENLKKGKFLNVIFDTTSTNKILQTLEEYHPKYYANINDKCRFIEKYHEYEDGNKEQTIYSKIYFEYTFEFLKRPVEKNFIILHNCMVEYNHAAYVTSKVYNDNRYYEDVENVLEDIKDILLNYTESTNDILFEMNKKDNLRSGFSITLEPEVESVSYLNSNLREIKLVYNLGNEVVVLSLNYNLYNLFYLVKKGYKFNNEESELAASFLNYWKKIVKIAEQQSGDYIVSNYEFDKRLKFIVRKSGQIKVEEI